MSIIARRNLTRFIPGKGEQMAETTSVLSSSEQIQANYEKYKSKFKDSTEEMVSSDTFLSLLVAEMTNQDPMEPTSNTEFVTQMAQFTSLQYSKDSATYSMSNYASSLVGKTVTASKMDGSKQVTKTGVVESVMKSGKTYTLKIDGVSFDISNVTSIGTTSDSSSGNTSSGSSLGELIARASMMIGMSATVNPGVEGGSLLDSGIISSIQVKDGQVRVIINDKGYLLDDIVEVAYPTIDSGDDNTSDKTEDSTDKTGDVTDKEDSGTQEQSAEALSYAAVQTDISDLEEVTGEIIPDRTVGEDIADLEDLI
ncbi:MAG TPA: hypothetical protein DDY65_08445 [Ruminococcaceae bacterium]|nr:hypothetical protein [Oscillospiraceae bacterium]